MTITDTAHAATRQHDTTTDTTQHVTSPKDIAVVKIMDQTRCTRDEAVAGILFIEDMVTKARGGERCNTPGTHHLTGAEMATAGYKIMDQIMPHGSTAEPGSAHALVQQIVLGSEEFALTHDNPSGRPDDCTVTVRVSKLT
jgi:hypothetical protein